MMNPQALLSSRLDFLAELTQRGRLLQIHTALPELALTPERLVLRESVSQPFELAVDCVSTSAHLELKRLIGEQVTVQLLQADGGYRAWHGYAMQASQLGADGGFARYRLVLAPWLALLRLRRDSFIFQEQSVQQILEDVFADYPQARFRFELSDELPVRATCTQYRESDFEFVQRLLSEEGLSYHFEHAADEVVEAGRAALHTLVITDRMTPREDLGTVRFAAAHETANLQGQRDAVLSVLVRRQLQALAVARGRWDPQRLRGWSAEAESALEFGDLPRLEDYDGAGTAFADGVAAAQRRADLALAALELGVKQIVGQGSARHFQAGSQFSLIDHPLFGANTSAFNDPGALTASHQRPDNRFTLLSVEHHATNNLGSQAAELLGNTSLERGAYRNHFVAAPAAAAVVPRWCPKPTAPGAQCALVVGLRGEALTTERDHRVRIQFPWQRGAKPLPGGLPHDESSPDAEGNAPGDQRSGTWVRVASPAAGANWGAVFTPRIGSEVLVDFVEGDIDRPVIVAGLYNGSDLPPFSAGIDAGVNHPGVISGLHTQSLDQSGYNQWAVDDATGQLRMRLLCSYTAAEVGLGHLIQQSPQGAQRGAWRGSGFEASTAAWASLRAGRGLLISTSARAATYGSAESTQMDAAEALAQLKAGQDLAQRLGQAAHAGQALGAHSAEDGQTLSQLRAGIDPQDKGRHPEQVNGQIAKKAQSGGRTLTDPVEAFAEPLIVLDTPNTQAWASDASIASYAGQDQLHISQGDHHEAAAHTHSIVAGRTASFYTHAGGLQAKAANGPVSLRAHTDELQILADQDVKIISVNGEIHIAAQSKIELIGADSGITLDGGDITFTTPGQWQSKGSAQAFLGGGSREADLPALPSQPCRMPRPEDLEFRYYTELGEGIPGVAYRVTLSDGSVRSGTLDSDGYARIGGVPIGTLAKIEYEADSRAPVSRVQAEAHSDWEEFLNLALEPWTTRAPSDPSAQGMA